MFLKWKKSIFKILTEQQKEGYQVIESLAYINRNKGLVNKNLCQGEFKDVT
jgi:hypothetical protein